MGSVRTRIDRRRVLAMAAAVVLLGLGSRARAIQLPICGDGIVQPAVGEQCDDAANPCCDPATCRFRAAGIVCAGSTACAQSVCNAGGSCLNLARDDGTSCDDGNPCTTGDQCLQGFCAGGPPLSCEDGNVCTDDTCNPQAATPAAACRHTPNQAPCDDGIFCNGTDTCADAACTHTGDPCAGGAECHRACDEAAGTCLDAAGTPCTDDGNGCTDDACNGAGACVHPANTAACDDGIFCNGVDVCAGGACIHAGDPCASGAPCDRTCNEAAGNCLSPTGTVCPDDGNVCTDDTCDGSGNCMHPNNSAPCDDGVFCNGTDTCAAGACNHAGDPCAGGPACDHTCREATKDCHDAPGGACPDDGNVCTDDTCDGQGTCAHRNNTSACDDGVFCNGGDTCQGGACVVHAGNPCASGSACDRTCNEGTANCLSPAGATCPGDGNVCTDDVCDGQGNCAHVANTAACDDGVFCNGADRCADGACVHAGDPCAGHAECDATCTEQARTCTAAANTACTDDQDVCTEDVCDGNGHCTHPAAPPTTMLLSASDATNATDRFCVDLRLANCGTPVGLLQGIVSAPVADFALEAGSVTCGELPDGYHCQVNDTGSAFKFAVVPPVTTPATCIDAKGNRMVVHFCLQDKAPICSGQPSVPLALTQVQAIDCGGDAASLDTRNGTVTCSGLLGDCNADGRIDVDDLLAQVDVALQSAAPTVSQRERCDDDCDGDVDIFDMRDEMEAILGSTTPPLPCSAEANTGQANDQKRLSMGRGTLRVKNPDAPIRGIQLTLMPTGGPVTVTGVKATRRTRGFTVVYRQLDPNGPVTVLIVSPTGRSIKRGAGQVARLSMGHARHRGRLHVTDVRIAR
jgi:hypothetical protein